MSKRDITNLSFLYENAIIKDYGLVNEEISDEINEREIELALQRFIKATEEYDRVMRSEDADVEKPDPAYPANFNSKISDRKRVERQVTGLADYLLTYLYGDMNTPSEKSNAKYYILNLLTGGLRTEHPEEWLQEVKRVITQAVTTNKLDV